MSFLRSDLAISISGGGLNAGDAVLVLVAASVWRRTALLAAVVAAAAAAAVAAAAVVVPADSNQSESHNQSQS